jgi:hypothetical protein
MVLSGYKEKEGESRTHFVVQTTTKTALHTTNIAPWGRDRQGNLITRPHDKEHILTHAAALQLISTKTSIPVPKLLGSGEEEYVFCHGNLHAETLHVLKVVDWDNAGFFPREFQRWTVRRDAYEELFENKKRCKELSDLMV